MDPLEDLRPAHVVQVVVPTMQTFGSGNASIWRR
jgi:hypothetical protein